MRAPGMTMHKMPLFAWGVLTRHARLLAPVRCLSWTGALTSADSRPHSRARQFFNRGRWRPIRHFQHLFWFLFRSSHLHHDPPAFGIVRP